MNIVLREKLNIPTLIYSLFALSPRKQMYFAQIIDHVITRQTECATFHEKKAKSVSNLHCHLIRLYGMLEF